MIHKKVILTRPILILQPSLARAPVAPVFATLSEPAKSTKWNFALRNSKSVVVLAAFKSSES